MGIRHDHRPEEPCLTDCSVTRDPQWRQIRHEYTGRTDRRCEVCGLADRHFIHAVLRSPDVFQANDVALLPPDRGPHPGLTELPPVFASGHQPLPADTGPHTVDLEAAKALVAERAPEPTALSDSDLDVRGPAVGEADVATAAGKTYGKHGFVKSYERGQPTLVCLTCGQPENHADHVFAKISGGPAECTGFIPGSGFGNNRRCGRCGGDFEAHPARAQ